MKRAFTLVEIMVVVAIIAILVGISVPTIRAYFNQAPLEKAISDLEGLCRTARAEAIVKQRSMLLTLNDGDNSLTLATAPRVVSEPDEVTGELVRTTEEASVLDQVTLDVELQIIEPQSLELGEDLQIRFYPNGTSHPLEVTITSGGEGYRLVLDPVTGHAKVTNLESE